MKISHLLKLIIFAVVIFSITACQQWEEIKRKAGFTFSEKSAENDNAPEKTKPRQGYVVELTNSTGEAEIILPAYCLNNEREIPAAGAGMSLYTGPPLQEMKRILEVTAAWKNDPQLFVSIIEKSAEYQLLISDAQVLAMLKDPKGIDFDSLGQLAVWALQRKINKSEMYTFISPSSALLGQVSSKEIYFQVAGVQAILDQAGLGENWDSESWSPPDLSQISIFNNRTEDEEYLLNIKMIKDYMKNESGLYMAEAGAKSLIVENTALDSKKRSYGCLLLAEIYAQQRNYRESFRTLQKSVELDPNNILAGLLLGKIYFDLSEWKKAVKTYEPLVSAMGLDLPERLEVLHNYAVSLYKMKRYEEASQAFYKLEEATHSTILSSLSPEKRAEIMLLREEAGSLAVLCALMAQRK